MHCVVPACCAGGRGRGGTARRCGTAGGCRTNGKQSIMIRSPSDRSLPPSATHNNTSIRYPSLRFTTYTDTFAERRGGFNY